MMNIPITKAIFDENEFQAITKPLETGWLVQGPYVAEFEKLFAEHVGVRYAKAVTSATTALHLGLLALGIGPGDKVVVPAFTYVASANAVKYTGAEVVFCDIDLATFNISLPKLETLLAKDPAIKAIMPISLFGLCADMPAIMQLAEKYNLKVIEDAACSFDSWIDKKHSGTFSHCAAFSFHPRKSITTGEGGMLITNDEKIADQVEQLRNHGAVKTDLDRHADKKGFLLYDFPVCGYNYRMTDIQGALGVCQMKKAKAIMSGRREIAKQYDEALPEFKQLMTPHVPANYTHGYQSYVCLFTDGLNPAELTMERIDKLNDKRNNFMEKLEANKIATRQGTHAVHTLSYYKNLYQMQSSDFFNAYAADKLSITLPLYANMTAKEFDYVIENIRKAFG